MLAAILLFASAPQSAPPNATVDKAWSTLRRGLEQKSVDKRQKAVHSLGIAPGNLKFEALAEKALKDPNESVRAEAAGALGRLKLPAAIPALHEALQDKQLKVVVASANALYVFRDPAAYDVYYALLTGERKGSTLLQAQMETLHDKKQMEKLMVETGVGFVPFGGMTLEAFRTITHDDTSPLRAEAAEKLAADHDAKSTTALLNACFDKKWVVRSGAVEALAQRGDPSAIAPLEPLLNDENDTVRYDAAAALIDLSDIQKPARRRDITATARNAKN